MSLKGKISQNKRLIVLAGFIIGILGTLQMIPKDLFSLPEDTIRMIASGIIAASALVFFSYYKPKPLMMPPQRETSLRVPRPPPSNIHRTSPSLPPQSLSDDDAVDSEIVRISKTDKTNIYQGFQ
jgi:hypothetical protein